MMSSAGAVFGLPEPLPVITHVSPCKPTFGALLPTAPDPLPCCISLAPLPAIGWGSTGQFVSWTPAV